MAAVKTLGSKLTLKKGMLMHPFLDGSGIVFFNTQSTVVSSISLSQNDFETWLADPLALDKADMQKLETLIEQGFLVEESAE